MACYPPGVPTLSHAIHAALAELQSSLAAPRGPGGTQLNAQRAQLTVAFALAADGTTNATSGGPHSVTVEFTAGELTAQRPASPALLTADATQPGTAVPCELTDALAQIFGPPGFDNSARAMVFREVFEGMSDEQALAVLTAAAAPATAGLDDAMRMPAHLVRGIIQSGPAKAPDTGISVLRSVLAIHPLAEVLRVVQREWKSQSDWL